MLASRTQTKPKAAAGAHYSAGPFSSRAIRSRSKPAHSLSAARARKQIDTIAERVPHAQRVKLDACGHSPHRDAPEKLNDAIAAFVFAQA